MAIHLLKRAATGVALASVLALATAAMAIPFSSSSAGGTVQIGGVGADYASFRDAADGYNAVNAGGGPNINGNWTVLIAANLAEANASAWGNTHAPGAKVVIKPDAPNRTVTFNFTGTVTGFFGQCVIGCRTLNLATASDIPVTNGAIEIDGSFNGTASRDLTFTNSTGDALGRIVRIVGEANGTVVKNLNVVNIDPTSTADCIGFGAGNKSGLGDFKPDDCRIENCVLQATAAAVGTGINSSITADGTLTVGQAIQGTSVTNCLITARHRAIAFIGMGAFSVTSNSISLNQTATGFNSAAILHSSNGATGWQSSIDRNQFLQLSTANATTGTALGVRGLELGGSGPSTYNVRNNIFSGISATAASGADQLFQIIFCSGGTNAHRIYHNSISVPALAGVANSTAGRAGIVIVPTFTTGLLDLRNNILRHNEASTNFVNIFAPTATNVTVQGNVESTGTAAITLASINSINYLGFAPFQAAGYDLAAGGGQSLDPSANWISATNLRFSSQPVGILGSTPIAGVLQDIDLDNRPYSKVYAGADEFLAAPLPVGVSSFVID